MPSRDVIEASENACSKSSNGAFAASDSEFEDIISFIDEDNDKASLLMSLNCS